MSCGASFVCALNDQNAIRCWGSNYSDAINVRAVADMLALNPARGGPRRVVCGRRFVCALQPTDSTVATGPGTSLSGAENWHAFCSGLAQDRDGQPQVLPNLMWPTELLPFTDFEAGGEHACGTRNYQLLCFGNMPPIPPEVTPRGACGRSNSAAAKDAAP